MLLSEDRELFMKWFHRVQNPVPATSPAWLLIAERHGDELLAMANELLRQGTKSDGHTLEAAPYFRLLAKSRAVNDPANALQWAIALDSSVQSAAISETLRTWAAQDPLGAWEQPNALDPGLRTMHTLGIPSAPVVCSILTQVAQEDPNLAIAGISAAWLKTDESSIALEWMKKNLPPAQRDAIMVEFVGRSLSPFYGATPEDHILARDWIEQKAPGTTRARLGPALVAEMATTLLLPCLSAQDEERTTPEERKSLVDGGRCMDRFPTRLRHGSESCTT